MDALRRRMVAEFAPSIYTNPWLAFYPGLAIGLTALAANLVGDGVDANDVPFTASFPYVASPHQGYEVP